MIASELTGREVKRTVVPDAEWRDAQVAQGLPPVYADLLLLSYKDARREIFAAVDGTLERLIGRRPKTIREVLADKLAPA